MSDSPLNSTTVSAVPPEAQIDAGPLGKTSVSVFPPDVKVEVPAVKTAVSAMPPSVNVSASAKSSSDSPVTAQNRAHKRKKQVSERQVEEAQFWLPQFREQMLLVYMSLTSTPVVLDYPLTTIQPKSKGPQASPPYVRVPEATQQMVVDNSKLIAKLRQRAKDVFVSWYGFEKLIAGRSKSEVEDRRDQGLATPLTVRPEALDARVLANLVNHTRYVLSRCMDLQAQKVWIGWLCPDAIEHMRNELDYFVARFNDTVSPDEEKLMWTRGNANRAALLAHCMNLDFKESRPIVDEALKLADTAQSALVSVRRMDLMQMAEMARSFDHMGFAEQVAQLLSQLWNNGKMTGTASASVPLVLLAHMLRSAQRSIVRLEKLATETAESTEIAEPEAAQPDASALTAGYSAPIHFNRWTYPSHNHVQFLHRYL